jgi:hypothetical protein
LKVLWESLAVSRQLGLKPVETNIDDGPGYHGWRYPPTNADEALGPVAQGAANAEPCQAEALWTFASSSETTDDREAIIEALGKLLIKRKELARSTGLAFLITNAARRASVLRAIAMAQSDKPTRD